MTTKQVITHNTQTVLGPQLCKELRDAGFPQDTLCGIYHLKGTDKDVWKTVINNSQPIDAACPNAQEIWAALPKTIILPDGDENDEMLISFELTIEHNSICYKNRFKNYAAIDGKYIFQSLKEVDDSLVLALAHLWLKLKSANLILV